MRGKYAVIVVIVVLVLITQMGYAQHKVDVMGREWEADVRVVIVQQPLVVRLVMRTIVEILDLIQLVLWFWVRVLNQERMVVAVLVLAVVVPLKYVMTMLIIARVTLIPDNAVKLVQGRKPVVHRVIRIPRH